MKPKILFKLTLKIPGTKILTDFLFVSREELESFLEVNKIKPFDVKMVIDNNTK